VVFQRSSSGDRKEQVLQDFNYVDGANPLAGLILDAENNLYGTTLDDLFAQCRDCLRTDALIRAIRAPNPLQGGMTVVISPKGSSTRQGRANSQWVKWPSMRRPVGVK